MRSSLALLSLSTLAFGSTQLERRAASCNTDVCLSALVSASASFSSFCATYTKVAITATTSLPAWASACKSKTSKLSSGCSCAYPATGTTTQISTASVVTTSSASKASVTTTSAKSSTISTSAVDSSTTSASKTSSGSACVRTSATSGAIVVDNSADPVSGSYKTLQSGVNALSSSSTTPQTVFIRPGTYKEQVFIPALMSNLTVQGYTTDCSSYEANTATITFNLALLDTTTDDLTATVRAWNANTKFYNINIDNTFGHVSTNGQNLAVSAHVGNQGYYGVQMIGYQDTVLAEAGTQLYAKSLIVGAVDFIFGQTALAWFENVDIRTIAAGCVTASGRDSASNPSWYVINNSNVAGINSTIAAGTNYLGRPWKSYARVVFQNTFLSDVIKPAGWSVWSTSTPNTEDVTFAEYNNNGPGSVLEEGPRASFSEQLSAAITIESVLGSSYKNEWWVDTSYL